MVIRVLRCSCAKRDSPVFHESLVSQQEDSDTPAATAWIKGKKSGTTDRWVYEHLKVLGQPRAMLLILN